MIIKIEKKTLPNQNILMGRLKSGCSCWNGAYFNG